MSTTARKILVKGVTELFGKDLFVLEFLLARQPERVERPASRASIRRPAGSTACIRLAGTLIVFDAADAGVDED